MLIQSSQYVSEQGGDGENLELHGQENDGAVVSIAKMNLILHNLKSAHIEYADTLEEPLNLKDGRLLQFDRVLANPPFSQNYTASRCQRPERFKYGFAPETGKKADLMFVQHMLASLKHNGRAAVVMPHGVLFRGGKEKQIRKGMLTDNGGVIEAIIGVDTRDPTVELERTEFVRVGNQHAFICHIAGAAEIDTVRELLGRVPVLGICLGHQLLGLAYDYEQATHVRVPPQFIPTIGDLDYVNVDSFQANTFWVNSYGAGKVFSWYSRRCISVPGKSRAAQAAVRGPAAGCTTYGCVGSSRKMKSPGFWPNSQSASAPSSFPSDPTE